jgi:cell division inhibitor SepF
MSIGDIFKRLVNVSDDDYEDVEDGAQETAEAPAFSASYESEYETPRPSRVRRQSSDSNRVVDIRTTAMLQVVLVKPDKFEDARAIADHLNEKRTVVLNLEAANKDVARRLIDLLNGVAYANGGQLKKVSTNTYIITPYNVNVSGDLLDELESTGVFF